MFKKNDQLKIKDDITKHHDYVSEMEKYQGTIVTVTGAWDGEFFIEEDGGMWTWYDEMVEI